MPEFLRTDNELTYFKQIRASCQRKDAPAFDRCPKLILHSVEFAIAPRGVRVIPTFSGGTVKVEATADEWPEADKLISLVPTDENSPDLEIDMEAHMAFLGACFDLAGKLLRRQYTLTDEQLAELLTFDGESVPKWIEQLLRWCNGLPTEIPPESELLLQHWLPPPEISPEEPAPTPEPITRRWWQFWRK